MPKPPSCRESEQVLTGFVQAEAAARRCSLFAQAEAMFRPPGDGAAVAARLARLRFEIDAYLGRLAAANRLLVLRLQERKRRDYERAYAMTDAIIGNRAAAAELRSTAPR